MSNNEGVLKAYATDDLVFTPKEQEMFSQDKQVRPRVSVFQRLGKVNEPKERNIQVLGNIQALKFINPKCKVHRCVLGVSFAGSCVLITGIH